ncbi:MAG: Holliday junction resolvase RuvX [Rhizobiales bacterium TMED143]|nr:Holliday junction resolvase RuvX [Rhodobiaceae bacterium]MBL6787118.1 Holliday junction resolvase RuvX [PS1 clade bacterium]OUV89888.1 MAG: Holliday junction resolvase RuvX [Rhizobiales bacterium TMED143]CAI8399772.1 MAG: Putative pre-16S rRNA nuclease [Rhodobiaceae bacterium UBA7378]HCQ81727.1 Holliday junction resolvase RuvX [Rhodobiaceae bacterium]|tara:strand:+ start:933 stop:1406 length:474 start_codon:yes stop_codon:yes gene_type:complete
MPIIDDPLSLPSHLSAGQRLLGLDLGTKTIGLALADTRHQIATPFDTIRRTKFGTDADQLADIVAQENIGALVLGLPLNMDGSAGPRVQATHAFVRNLAARDGFPDLPVLLWDERLSTAAVERTLIDADTSRAKRGAVIDKMAAAFILQGVLDRLNG